MAAVLDGTDTTPDSPYDPAALDAVSSYEEELRVSREDLLRKIEASSRDIAGRCRTAVEQSQEQEHAALFDDEERERVVEAYAAHAPDPLCISDVSPYVSQVAHYSQEVASLQVKLVRQESAETVASKLDAVPSLKEAKALLKSAFPQMVQLQVGMQKKEQMLDSKVKEVHDATELAISRHLPPSR